MTSPKHVGGPNSIHNAATITFHDFHNQRSSVRHKVSNYSKDALVKYETHLETSLSIVNLLALQAESFQGHYQTSTSLNKVIF
jgi:phosphoglycerol transferase MdoB-like AlkP superfamily enzyme